MSQRIVDLDALVGAPIKAQLGGKLYELPADCPAPLYLKLLHFAEIGDTDEGADPAVVQELYDEVLALFQIHNPKLERIPLGLQQLVVAVGAIYGSDGELDSEDAEPDPTNPAGTPSSKPKKKTSSRSSRS